MKKGRKDFLARSFTKAVETLSKKPQGFFMMLEGAQIDYGGHANDLEYVVRETLDFDLTKTYICSKIGATLQKSKGHGGGRAAFCNGTLSWAGTAITTNII